MADALFMVVYLAKKKKVEFKQFSRVYFEEIFFIGTVIRVKRLNSLFQILKGSKKPLLAYHCSFVIF